MFSAPTRIAPAASRRAIKGASAVAGAWLRLIFAPASVGRPATSIRFFTANGTPASGPGSTPAAIAASKAPARDRARSAVTAVKAFSTGLSRSILSRHAVMTPVAVERPDATAAAMSVAVANAAVMRETPAPDRDGPAGLPAAPSRRGPRRSPDACAPPGAIASSFRCPKPRCRPRSVRLKPLRPRSASGFGSQPGSPAAEVSDVLRIPNARRLCQKAEAWATVQRDGAESKRRWHVRQQFAHGSGRQRPDFAGDGGSIIGTHHPRAVAQREQAVSGLRRGLLDEAATERGDLQIQWQPGHVRADAEQASLVRRQ